MHKATLIGIPAVVPPAGFELRPAAAPAASEPPAAAAATTAAPPEVAPPPPAPPALDSYGELSLEKKLSSVPPPPEPEKVAASAPPSRAPVSQPTPGASMDASREVDAEDLPQLRPSRWLWLLAAAAVLLLVGYWTMLRPQAAETFPTTPAVSEPVAATPVATAPSTAKEAQPAPAPSSAPSATIEAAAATASAAPAASASAEPAPAASGATVVIVTARPPEAKFYFKGKEAGTSPLRVELAPGEKRAYEVGLKGYGTRKVVVDGKKAQIDVGLKPIGP